MSTLKLISWNVNGLRACMHKGFLDFFDTVNADIVCLQETKLQEGQIQWPREDYHAYWNYAEKKGYSGTAVFSREEPLAVTRGIGIEEHDHEGRVLTLEYPSFYLVNVYTPNSQRELTRLEYRMQWEDAFRAYLNGLRQHKPVAVCGDLNVAHTELDLKNPKSNHNNAGFTDAERGKMTELLDSGWIDTLFSAGPDGCVFLVVLYVPCPRKERRVENRLFSGFRGAGSPSEGRFHPQRRSGIGSLSGGIGY